MRGVRCEVWDARCEMRGEEKEKVDRDALYKTRTHHLRVVGKTYVFHNLRIRPTSPTWSFLYHPL